MLTRITRTINEFAACIRTTTRSLQPIVTNHRSLAIQIAFRRPLVTARLRDGTCVSFRANRLGDTFVFHEVFAEHIYSPILPQPSRRLATVLDIGAHVGCFALWIAPHADSIHCFEPDAGNRRLLKSNITQNRLAERVSIYEDALGGFDGSAALYQDSRNTALSSIVPWGANDKYSSKMIHVLTLGSVLDRCRLDRCDLVKMDCEGAEYDALGQMPESVSKRIGSLVIEVHQSNEPSRTPETLVSILESHGYRTRCMNMRANTPIGHGIGLVVATRTEERVASR